MADYLAYKDHVEIYKDSHIQISDVNRSSWYMIAGYRQIIVRDENGSIDEKLSKTIELNAVTSYHMKSGPMQPFQIITLTIPRKKLAECAPDLLAPNAVVPGANKLSVRYYGVCTDMVVTKFKISGDKVTITAYCAAEVLRGAKTQIEFIGTPFDFILECLTTKTYLSMGYRFTDWTRSDDKDYSIPARPFWAIYDEDINRKFGSITIPIGTNVWYALQICAMSLGCMIFFANDCAYLVDYRRYSPQDSDIKDGILDLPPITIAPTGEKAGRGLLDKCLAGAPVAGDEGIEVVSNNVLVKGTARQFSGLEASLNCVCISSGYSMKKYGDRPAQDIDTKFLNLGQCALFGQAYIDYRKEPQQSLRIELKEVQTSSVNSCVWMPALPDVVRVSSIEDGYNDISIDNKDGLGRLCPQKLYLSSITRNFPEGTSTYEFGAAAYSDLAQATSEIRTAQGR